MYEEETEKGDGRDVQEGEKIAVASIVLRPSFHSAARQVLPQEETFSVIAQAAQHQMRT